MPASVLEELQKRRTPGAFVVSDHGQRLYPTSPTTAFRKHLEAYNEAHPGKPLPVITLHDLRHTSATALLESGVGIETVSKRLGHSRASVTLDVYGHSYEHVDRTAAETLDKIIRRE